jgi:hypothetical protein
VTAANRFGAGIGMWHVRRWAEAGVRLWLPDYLRDSEREHGYTVGRADLPNSWHVAEDRWKWPEQQLTAIVIQAPGLAAGGEPRREGDGDHSGRWAVALTAVVRGSSEVEREVLASVYELALRKLFLQQATGFSEQAGYTGPDVSAETAEWADSGIDDLPQRTRSRTLAAATATFRVGMRGLATDTEGPTAPALDPLADPGPWPSTTAEKVTVTTTHQPEGVEEP